MPCIKEDGSACSWFGICSFLRQEGERTLCEINTREEKIDQVLKALGNGQVLALEAILGHRQL
ncbi:hypothetical protein DRP07_00110 [Archaeoglobales archaeon]|nr:MAG: hypothetical protein DRP07_00110 [Archaeoglobales archaeon]